MPCLSKLHSLWFPPPLALHTLMTLFCSADGSAKRKTYIKSIFLDLLLLHCGYRRLLLIRNYTLWRCIPTCPLLVQGLLGISLLVTLDSMPCRLIVAASDEYIIIIHVVLVAKRFFWRQNYVLIVRIFLRKPFSAGLRTIVFFGYVILKCTSGMFPFLGFVLIFEIFFINLKTLVFEVCVKVPFG